MSRKVAREQILKFLFSLDFNRDENSDQMIEEFFNGELSEENNIFHEANDLTKKDKAFCVEIIKGVVENLDSIDELIQENSISWKKNRIAKVDLAILRLAVFEILHRDDIPVSATANEAIELGKKYSSEESGKFINGILGNIIKNKPQETL